MSTPATSSSPSPRAGESGAGSATATPPRLQTRHVTMMGLGSAIGAGLFLGVGVGIQIAGTSILLAYALAGVIVMYIMRMLGMMAAAYPSSGAFATYAGMAFGPWAKFLIAWMYWFMLIMVMGAEITGASAIISQWFNIDPWIPSLIAVTFFAVVNFASVRGFGEFEFWFAIIKVAVIVAFLAVGLLMVFGWWPWATLPGASISNFTDSFMPNGLSGFAAGLLAVAFAFGGIELVTIAAAESENPGHDVAAAVRAVVFRIVVFYLGSIAIITVLLPFDAIQGADAAAQSPFTLVTAGAGLPFAAGFLEVVIVVALLSAFNAQIYGTSRLVHDMAQEGQAPALFAQKNSQNSPVYAVTLSMVLAFASVGLQYWNPPGLLTFLFNAVGGCLVVLWAGIILSFIKLRPGLPHTELKMAGERWVPWATLGALGALVVLMAFDPAARPQLSAVLVIVVVILAVYAASQFFSGSRKRRDSVS